MALLQVTYLSKALKKSSTFHMYLPNDTAEEMKNENYERSMKVLFLLHGFTGCSIDWVSGGLMQEVSLKYNMAVIMPSGDNSFYLNYKGTGHSYCEFVGKEIVEYVNNTFHLNIKRNDTYIGGLSMGGFGAIHTGLSYPETFGKIIALSSALIIHDIKHMKEGDEDSIADFDYYTSVFGPLDKVEESKNNPESLICDLKKRGVDIPQIYMACGTEDFLLEQNRAFYRFLKQEAVDVEYYESPGIHDWKFWNEYLDKAVYWAQK